MTFAAKPRIRALLLVAVLAVGLLAGSLLGNALLPFYKPPEGVVKVEQPEAVYVELPFSTNPLIQRLDPAFVVNVNKTEAGYVITVVAPLTIQTPNGTRTVNALNEYVTDADPKFAVNAAVKVIRAEKVQTTVTMVEPVPGYTVVETNSTRVKVFLLERESDGGRVEVQQR